MNRFLQRYAKMAGREISSVELKKVIRLNTLKTAEKEILQRLSAKGVVLRKLPYLRYGYEVVSSPFSLGATPEYLQGHYYLQGAASQLPVEILDPQPGDIVLDLCAAPGSKTTQLAQWMNNQGTLFATELTHGRLQTLRNNLERMGVTNSVLYQKDGRFVNDIKIQFDKILVDAPCSGNFVDEENWFEKRSMTDFLKCASTQRQLLSSASKVLKSGGILVYSTCSLEPEEDEEVVQWALDNLGLELVPANIPNIPPKTSAVTQIGEKQFSQELSTCLRLWPDILPSEGFFVAKFRKK